MCGGGARYVSVAGGNANKKKTRRNGTGLDLEGVNRRN